MWAANQIRKLARSRYFETHSAEPLRLGHPKPGDAMNLLEQRADIYESCRADSRLMRPEWLRIRPLPRILLKKRPCA